MNDHNWLDQIDQIDQTWDEIVTTSGQTRRRDAMTETMLRLHHLAAETVPPQAIDRVWNRLAVSSAPTVSGSRRRVRPLRHLWGARESRPMSAVATVALLVLVTLSGYYSINGNRTVAPTGDVDYRLYTHDYDGSTIQELDPLTLADVSEGLPIGATPYASPEAGETVFGEWQVSSDGTTLVGRLLGEFVTADGETGQRVVVIDARTGVERLSFMPTGHRLSSIPTLNASGSRVAFPVDAAVQTNPPTEGIAESSPVRWLIFDTTTGELLSQIESLEDRDPMGWGSGWLDPAGTRFYRLSVDRDATYPGPWPVQLVTHDVQSGQELSRIDLPTIRVGYWPGEPAGGDPPCGSELGLDANEPIWLTDGAGVAISPDGTTMAIVHPDGRVVTMVDLRSMQVARTLTLPESPVVSPVAVDDASCPLQTDRVRGGMFSPDGASLYVIGVDLPAMDRASGWVVAAPLMRIDVETGTVESSVAVDGTGPSFLGWPLVQSPDGSNLYSVRYDVRGGTTTVERRDPETLAILATREYVSPRNIVVIAK